MEIGRKAKTHKGRKLLELKKGKLKEGPRQTLFLKRKSSQNLTNLTLFLHSLKKDFSKRLTKKNDYHPFEDTKSLLFHCEQSICSNFVFCNHSKKRPNSITFGRVYDSQILEMFEFKIKSMSGNVQ